jgi:hypothetical protein
MSSVRRWVAMAQPTATGTPALSAWRGEVRRAGREEGELLLRTPFSIPVLRLPVVISFGVFPYI